MLSNGHLLVPLADKTGKNPRMNAVSEKPVIHENLDANTLIELSLSRKEGILADNGCFVAAFTGTGNTMTLIIE